MSKTALKIGDSVYVRSKGWISNVITYVSSGGRTNMSIPSHEARVYSLEGDEATLIEVNFSGKRFYSLEKYIKSGVKVWIKRDDYLTEGNTLNMLAYLNFLTVKGYDWGLIAGFGTRFILRKLTPKKWNWNWVTEKLESKVAFVCSEFQNAGRRSIGMKVKENETPYDNFRKIPAQDIVNFNV